MTPDRGPQPMDLGQLSADNKTKDKSYKKITGPLTPAKRELLRKWGACFYCRQQGHTVAECPLKASTTKSEN